MKRKLILLGVRFFCLFVFLFSVVCFFCSSARANIVLKVVGVNPSPDKEQEVSVNVYLPAEVKPEHIVEKGDLEIGYDDKKGAYYVYGKYNLAPGGVVEREVEMQDVWMIEETELKAVREEIQKIASSLKRTNMEEKVNALKEKIDEKINRIFNSQKMLEATPERHISKSRENIRLLREVKEDLVTARGFLGEAKIFSKVVVWKVFLAIIGFLAVMAVSFYFIWQKQAKAVSASGSAAGIIDNKKIMEPSKRGEEEMKLEDVERIMNEDKES